MYLIAGLCEDSCDSFLSVGDAKSDSYVLSSFIPTLIELFQFFSPFFSRPISLLVQILFSYVDIEGTCCFESVKRMSKGFGNILLVQDTLSLRSMSDWESYSNCSHC